MIRRKKNPLAPRSSRDTHTHTRATPSPEKLWAMSEDATTVSETASQWLARWHNAGQSEWLGGDTKTGRSYEPPARIKAAFKKMSDAMHAASSASHELTMLFGEESTKHLPAYRPNPAYAPSTLRKAVANTQKGRYVGDNFYVYVSNEKRSRTAYGPFKTRPEAVRELSRIRAEHPTWSGVVTRGSPLVW